MKRREDKETAVNGVRRGKRWGMREILWVYIIIFVAVMLCVLWLFQSLFLDDFYRAIKKREITRAYGAALSALGEEEREAREESARMIAERYGVCISAYGMEGADRAVTLISTHTLPHCVLHSTDARAKLIIYEHAKKMGGSYLEYFVYDGAHAHFEAVSESEAAGDDELSMVYASVISDGEGGETLVILNSVISPVSATVKTLYVQLAGFTVLFILAGTLFAFIISKRLTRPIEELTSAAKRFGEGELEPEGGFSADGYREIQTLSETLDFAASELAKTDRLRRELVANVSHDLRTPLTMIIGYGEMMRDIPDENTPENASNIVEEAERLSRLVTDMMDLSRLQSGTAQIERKRYSLTDQLESAIRRMNEMMLNKGFAVSFESGGVNAAVNCDETRVGQVFYNLLINAIEHTGEDRTVRVRQIVDGGWVTVSVTDSGAGIPPERLGEIWERYYKINSAHRRGKGTGLGLSIVKAIMEQLGGHYGVESRVGAGSTFWFALPLSSEGVSDGR